jgi:hypothetical protein
MKFSKTLKSIQINLYKLINLLVVEFIILIEGGKIKKKKKKEKIIYFHLEVIQEVN